MFPPLLHGLRLRTTPAMLVLLPLASAPQQQQPCADALGECATFAQLGECRGRRSAWMRENCAASCDLCAAPAPPRSADGGGDSWALHVVQLKSDTLLTRFQRSNKRAMVRPPRRQRSARRLR